MKRLATLSIGLSLLAACGDTNLNLPTGEQEVTGLLTVAELALDRRGSHALINPDTDEKIVFVESPTVNLGEFENRYVTLRGVYEANITSDDLPVLVVDTVVDVENSEGKTITLDELGISFVIPVSWGTSEAEGSFSVFSDPMKPSTIEIYTERIEAIEELESPTSIIVGGKPAYRVTGADSQTVYLKYNNEPEEYVTFAYSPHPNYSGDEVRQMWLEFLSSIKVEEEERPSSPNFSGSGTALPCGGTANIICPQGQFCKITDAEYQVGVCVNLATE